MAFNPGQQAAQRAAQQASQRAAQQAAQASQRAAQQAAQAAQRAAQASQRAAQQAAQRAAQQASQRAAQQAAQRTARRSTDARVRAPQPGHQARTAARPTVRWEAEHTWAPSMTAPSSGGTGGRVLGGIAKLAALGACAYAAYQLLPAFW